MSESKTLISVHLTGNNMIDKISFKEIYDVINKHIKTKTNTNNKYFRQKFSPFEHKNFPLQWNEDIYQKNYLLKSMS